MRPTSYLRLCAWEDILHEECTILETHKGDAGIIIFRNIVSWTIRKQAFKFANYMIDCGLYEDQINEDEYLSDNWKGVIFFDCEALCFTIKSDDRWTTRTFEIEPFVTNDARRLNKTFNIDDATEGRDYYEYRFYMIPNNGRLVNHSEQWALSEP